MPATIQVKSREVLELKFLMSTLSFPLFYIGLVFLCVAFTVLSVQQLSDSNKYKFRYQILNKLGMGKKKNQKRSGKTTVFILLMPGYLIGYYQCGIYIVCRTAICDIHRNPHRMDIIFWYFIR